MQTHSEFEGSQPEQKTCLSMRQVISFIVVQCEAEPALILQAAQGGEHGTGCSQFFCCTLDCYELSWMACTCPKWFRMK